VQQRLNLTEKQKKQLAELQKETDGKLTKLLTDAQNKQLKGMRAGPGRGGPGGFGGGGFGRGGFGGFGGGRPPDAVYKWEVYCLSAADGKVLWHRTAAAHKPTTPKQAANTYASETPVTDGQRIYAYFGMTGVFCYDLDGNLIWKKGLGSYPMALGFGTGSSPVLDGERLFIQCDNEEKSFLIALDKKTGNKLWEMDRTERSDWSTPFIWKNRVRTELVCMGGPHVRSYDPATGKQLWQLAGMQQMPKTSPAATADLLFVGSGYQAGFGSGIKPLFAVKAGASGDISLKEGATSNKTVAWYLPQAAPGLASPLVYEGLLYVPDQRGNVLTCYDAKSGKRVYRERLEGATGFTASPWAYGGKVFCLDGAGTTFVVKAGRQFKLLGKAPIGEQCWASPAVGEKALFLRSVDRLYCIKKNGADK
jgi:outer membrane protein assembly factor BamB